jgi:sugar phosphate isomerase/epimerase
MARRENMKYSVFTVCMPEFTVEEAIEKLAEWGYDGVEWRVTNQQPSKDGKPGFWTGNHCTISLDEVVDRAKEVGRRCRAAGIEVTSIASYLSSDQLKDVERIFEACTRMDTSQARVGVPNYDGSVHYRRLFDKALADYAGVEKLARKYGVRANVEIHMGNITPSASAAYRFVSHFDPAHVGVIHDAGNMVTEGFENYQFGLELLGEYLAEVHVKNAAWSKGKTGPHGLRLWQRSWTELNEGQVNWAEVMTALKSVGYNGWLSLEDFSTRRPTAEKLPDALRLLKELEASVRVEA